MPAIPRKVLRREHNGIDSIEVYGPFDYQDLEIDNIIDNVLAEGKKDVVLNLANSSHLTSPGIASLIKALKKLNNSSGTLYVFGATPDMVDLLNLTKLGKYINFI